MAFDERRLDELIVESQDLQHDAMVVAKQTLPDARDLANDRRHDEIDPDAGRVLLDGRRRLLRNLTIGGVAAGVFGPAINAILASPVAAQSGSSIDVMILQTASSLERLAVDTYGAALTLPFMQNETIKTFAQTTMMQHDEHKKAFQARTEALDGQEQNAPNPKYAPVVEQAKPMLKQEVDVVKLAATLEQVARDTYLADLEQFTDKEARTLMATVMGVETQHLATLRAVEALLSAGEEDLVAIPTMPAQLPAAAGRVGFPDAIPKPTQASPPAEGAIK